MCSFTLAVKIETVVQDFLKNHYYSEMEMLICVWPKLVKWRFNVVKMKKKIQGSFGSKPKMVQSLTLTVLSKLFFRTSKGNTVMTHYSGEQSTDSSLSKWNSHSLLGQSHDLYCVWGPNFYIHVSCIRKKIGIGSYCV